MKCHLTHLELENWRNFVRVDIDLQPRMFIVGPNAAGKTNLLDSIRFLADLARPEGSLARAVSARGGIAHLRSLHARQQNQVKVRVKLDIEGDAWEYELVLAGNRSVPHRIVRERVNKNGDELLSRPTAEDQADARLLEQTHVEQLSQNASFRELVGAFASITHIHVVPQVARSLIRSDSVARRDSPGSDFIENLAGLSEKRRAGALRRIQRLLRSSVPHFGELRIVRDARTGQPHLEAKYSHWRPQGGWQNEQEFSDGTLRLIGLIWAILEGQSPLLLEEPELSLHEAVVRALPRLLTRAANSTGRQVLVTTHSERFLDDRGIDPSEILMLKPGPEATETVLGSEDPNLVRAARAQVPLGPLAIGATSPVKGSQLSWEFFK